MRIMTRRLLDPVGREENMKNNSRPFFFFLSPTCQFTYLIPIANLPLCQYHSLCQLSETTHDSCLQSR
uniref:Uncharacterized protein n=1 Tax=Caenorhabditis japonica TaxID=281687 RepID=A0A8R1IZK0_CAEJA